MRHTVPSAPPPQQRHHDPIQRSTSVTVYKQPHLTTIHSSALSSLRKVFITESARNKLSSSHHALNSLLFALDGYPTATEDPAEIEETARTGTVGGLSAETGSPLRGTHSSLREDFTHPSRVNIARETRKKSKNRARRKLVMFFILFLLV